MVEGVCSEGTDASEGDFSILGCCTTGAVTDAGVEADGTADDAGALEAVEGPAGWGEGADTGADGWLRAGPESSSKTPAWRGRRHRQREPKMMERSLIRMGKRVA